MSYNLFYCWLSCVLFLGYSNAWCWRKGAE